MAGRRPDYNVSAMIKPDDGGDIVEKGNVGVAWNSDKGDGRISIKLHGFVKIEARPGLFVTLFPIEERDEGQRPTTTKRPARGGKKSEDMDDDIPF